MPLSAMLSKPKSPLIPNTGSNPSSLISIRDDPGSGEVTES